MKFAQKTNQGLIDLRTLVFPIDVAIEEAGKDVIQNATRSEKETQISF
jgi:hypothetical protein